MEYKKGSLCNEGKTKKIWDLIGTDGVVIVENQKAINCL